MTENPVPLVVVDSLMRNFYSTHRISVVKFCSRNFRFANSTLDVLVITQLISTLELCFGLAFCVEHG